MYKVLMVDDDRLVRKGLIAEIYKEELDIEEILEANNGEEALQLYFSNKEINLIITDIKMPKMDGVELIRQVKAHDGNMPIIIISGYNEFEYLRQAIRYGVNDYLLKPIDPVELRDVIQAIIDKETLKGNEDEPEDLRIRDYTLYRLAEGNIGRQELQQKMEMLDLVVSNGPYLVAEICFSQKTDEVNIREIALFLHQVIRNQNAGNVFVHPAERILCILDGVESEEEKKKILQDAVGRLTKYTGLVCVFGPQVDDVESISFSFRFLSGMEKTEEKRFSSLISKVVEYVDMHYRENITLKELADLFYINPSYLGTIFKREVGWHFTDYVNKKRIEYAVELLKDSNMKVYEIVEEVGFCDKNYFLRLFRKFTGTTPTQIRNTTISRQK